MNIKIYLKQWRLVYKNSKQLRGVEFYDWLLKEGKLFTKVKQTNYDRGKKKECYYNAQMLAIGEDDVQYYEGFATTRKLGIPFEHGFNMQDDKVIDVTWDDGDAYFGICIPKDYVRQHLLKFKMAENLINRYFFDIVKGDVK